MAYFPDLSPYEYGDYHEPMLNVGWLSSQYPFEQGNVSAEVIAILLLLAEKPLNVMRGLHYCDFCDKESPIRVPAPTPKGFVSLGTGELHVRRDRVLYSAPTMIVHYILDHDYKPPVGFLLGVEGLAI